MLRVLPGGRARKPAAAPGDLPPRPADADGPGVDLATLDGMIARLEEP